MSLEKVKNFVFQFFLESMSSFSITVCVMAKANEAGFVQILFFGESRMLMNAFKC